MADVAFASTGACFSTESLRNGEAPSICERSSSASLRCCLPESLSFEKSLSVRLPFPSLRSHVRLRQAPVQVNAAVGYPASITWWKKGDQPNMREIHSAQEFVEAITKAEDKLVLVDFYSIGCRSCKALHPKICQIAAENPDIDILKVNFYDNNVLCRSLNVNIMPFFHFYRGKEGRIDAFSCSLTKINKLREAVAKYKKGHLVMPSPGPISPVAKRKDLLVLPTPARATAGSVS